MPTPRTKLTGPADTDSPDEHVTSGRTTPTENHLRGGQAIPATVPVAPRPVAGPLQLAGEPRLETYELLAPGNVVVEVTRNIDTGEQSLVWTDRTELAT
jgi:hypothetical protein